MSKFTSLKPMLYTKQLKDTIDFYTQVLGFECAAFEAEWGWASLIKDDVEIMLAYPNTSIPFESPVFSGSFYIQTENVELLWEQCKDKSTICYPIEDFEYGMREFAIYDNNGYLLQFGQELS